MPQIKKTEIILGIDPGFGRTGWGVIENSSGDWRAVAYGCIETSAEESFLERLEELHVELIKIIKKYQPTRAGVEDLFFAKNVKTALKVGQARGVILLTLRENGLSVDEYTPLQIKQTMTGYGRADKGQVERMVKLQFGIKNKIIPDDAADALAVAMTVASGLSFKKRLEKSL